VCHEAGRRLAAAALGPAARARRAKREAEARADLDRMRRERDRESRLRREHDRACREDERREEFERRVDETVAALEREATLPLRELVRRVMLAGGDPLAPRSQTAPSTATALPRRARFERGTHEATRRAEGGTRRRDARSAELA